MRNFKNYGNLSAGLIGLSGVVLFSAKSVFAKMAYGYRVDPISVLYLRMVFSFPLVLLVGYYYERRTKRNNVHWPDISKKAIYCKADDSYFDILPWVDNCFCR